MTTFCIVTPVLNGVKYLNIAITHVVSQIGDFHIRYHIQDGGSTDGTLEIIRKWEAMLSSNCPIVQCKGVEFSWISEPDNGMYDAINKGFERMTIGDDAFMSWCNCDDMYLPGVFSTLASISKDQPKILYIAGDWRFFEDGKVFEFTSIKGPYPQEIMQNYCCDHKMWCQPPQPSIFWKGLLWRQTGQLNSNLRFAGDYEYWQRLSLHAECFYWPLSISMCIRHDEQLVKKYSSSDFQTFYIQEKESICSINCRKAFMRKFWKKRILPPIGFLIDRKTEGYYIKKVRCWPIFWGSSWIHYLLRRYNYAKFLFKRNLYKLCKKILNMHL